MASPTSSSSPANKRKRSSSNLSSSAAAAPRLSTADQLQPSSRDASGEEGDESAAAAAATAAASSGGKARKVAPTSTSTSTQDSTSTGLPPSKRPRTRSVPSSEAANANGATGGAAAAAGVTSSPSISKVDPGEPSETTEASADIENRSSKRRLSTTGRHTSSTPSSLKGQQEPTGTSKPPAKGRLQDPAGYSTNPPPTGRPVRVYADGVFDLFHLGHMRQLEQAKNAFPDTYLIVGVTGDEETHMRKGLTVLGEKDREETVRHCKWVDEVIPRCPWIVDTDFLEEHKIDYVAHDDLPYGADEGDDIYAPIKARGQFLATQRTEGVSTTGIITRVVRDYDQYITRQLKRGTSRKDLNVSWLKKNELDIKRHVLDLRESIKNNWSTTGQEVGKELRQFWQNSRPSSPARANSDHGPRSGVSSPRGEGSVASLLGPAGASRNRLDPHSPGRPDSPSVRRNDDFATGYSLGLIGGVRSWMMRSRTSLRDSVSHPTSPSGSDDDRERNGVQARDENEAAA